MAIEGPAEGEGEKSQKRQKEERERERHAFMLHNVANLDKVGKK